MRICPICNRAISKGNDMAVLSYPVKAINTNADYSLMNDFIDNETLMHNKCFEKCVPSLLSSLSNDEVIEDVKIEEEAYDNQNLCSALKEALSTMGEKVSTDKIQTFLIQNNSSGDLGSLVGLWFKNRSYLD